MSDPVRMGCFCFLRDKLFVASVLLLVIVSSKILSAESAVLEEAVDNLGLQVDSLLPDELGKELKAGLITIHKSEGSPITLDQSLLAATDDPFWKAWSENAELPLTGPLPKVPTELDASDPNAILWKVNSLWWRVPYAKSTVLAEVRRGTDVIRNYYFTHRRVYPAQVDPEHSSEQLFRERLHLDFPAAIAGFSWLHYRFRGADCDMLWYFSKAINKSRQLTSANTSDRLLSLSMSLEDVYVWNGRPDDYEVTASEPRSLLSPYVRDEMVRLLEPGDSGCTRVELVSAKKVLGFSGQGVPDESGWPYIFGTFDARAGYVPAQVQKLVLNKRDPYSLYGREVLYVDAQSGVPYYKFVYDRRGRLWKSMIGFFYSGVQGLKNVVPPRPIFLYLHDHQKRSTSVYTFYEQELCANLSEEAERNLSLSDIKNPTGEKEKG